MANYTVWRCILIGDIAMQANQKRAFDNQVGIMLSSVVLMSFNYHGDVDVNITTFNATNQLTAFIMRGEECLYHCSINLLRNNAFQELADLSETIKSYEPEQKALAQAQALANTNKLAS